MIVGIPKEVKSDENRVSLTPAGTLELTKRGHVVYIEKNAGKGTGFSNSEYINAGAKILDTAKEIFDIAELIVKVKEPIEQEFDLIKKGQLIFTYFHFASYKPLLLEMLKKETVCLAYETVELEDKSLPLLIPMSEVAGRMATQQGAKYLEKPQKGRGILLGGVPGVRPAKVLVLGGGVVGTQAAKMAAGLGANVSIMDINLNRLRQLEDILPANVTTLYSNELNIRKKIKTADLVIGAVLIPGSKAPNLITRDMLKTMKKGAVLVDVAVDQGGCFETCTPTTHKNPTFIIDDVVHYCFANMPGAVPYTSTVALTNATLPYIIQVANKGWKKACEENTSLKKGLNAISGDLVYKAVAESFSMEYVPIEKHLN